MEKKQSFTALLGLDIGRVNTRASYFGISDGKFCLQGAENAPTSLGPSSHLGSGAGDAMRQLEKQADKVILQPDGGLLLPVNARGHGVDQVALALSTGPEVRTIILGITEKGSIAAGRALVDSLPLALEGVYGLTELADEPGIIETLVRIRPEIIIITGGEDAGAESPVRRWIEIIRLVCELLPPEAKPTIFYAGNPLLKDTVSRRLEPVTDLRICPNLQPKLGEWDLIPAQAQLDQEILRIWRARVPGLADLDDLAESLWGTKHFGISRMVRYLSWRENSRDELKRNNILAVDLGANERIVSAGVNGKANTIRQSSAIGRSTAVTPEIISEQVFRWTAANVTLQDTLQYLFNKSLTPRRVPENVRELALSQAHARVQLQLGMEKLSRHYPDLLYDPQKGLTGHFEPVIASGAALTQAPTPGQAMLMLLDGLQPWGITTMVLDRYHLLPLLGVVGGLEPVLPVHVLGSDAFTNLGTVVAAVSADPKGEKILSIQVKSSPGKDYTVDIEQGSLRRLVIPAGVSAELELTPSRLTNIGFGEPGMGGRLKVTGGTLGVVIDARGRPLQLPDDDEVRIETLRRWLWTLGG